MDTPCFPQAYHNHLQTYSYMVRAPMEIYLPTSGITVAPKLPCGTPRVNFAPVRKGVPDVRPVVAVHLMTLDP